MAKRPILSEKVVQRHLARRPHNREMERSNLYWYADPQVKEFPPFYELKDVCFDAETRTATVTVLAIKITDRMAYPIATPKGERVRVQSAKTEEKEELRALLLTNEMLENLNNSDDPAISCLALDIVGGLNAPELYPSWFIEEIATLDMDFEIEKASKGIEFFKSTLKEGIKDLSAQITKQGAFIKKSKALKEKHTKTVLESDELCKNMLQNPKAYFKFPLFARSRIQKKVEPLKSQTARLRVAISNLAKDIEEAEQTVLKLQQDLDALPISCEESIANEMAKIDKARDRYHRIINNIVPLPYDVTESS